jgi:hypothetical protein
MSLPDVAFHALAALGRHLTAPVHLRGVRCEPPVWDKGHRLPGTLTPRHYLLCRREGIDRVEIEVETKWGSCRREIPAGDTAPRCREWFGRTSAGLNRLSRTACPPLPQPTARSRRGTTPSGASWVVVTEGTGPSVEPGRRILFNETVLTRSYAVASSTHFSGEPRRALLDGEELPPWLVEGITGMRAGERRRLFVLPLSAARSRDPEHSPADDPLYHDIELLAIEPRE